MHCIHKESSQIAPSHPEHVYSAQIRNRTTPFLDGSSFYDAMCQIKCMYLCMSRRVIYRYRLAEFSEFILQSAMRKIRVTSNHNRETSQSQLQ